MEEEAALRALAACTGEGTAVVSYVIAPSTSVAAARDFVRREIATAANIKDKRNRAAVADALRAIGDTLAKVRALPPTGLATFAGQCV